MHSAAFIMRYGSGFSYPTRGIELWSAQIFFNTLPFHGYNNLRVLQFVTKGKRPKRLENPRMKNDVWDLIHNCMETIPSQRPTMECIVTSLTSFLQSWYVDYSSIPCTHLFYLYISHVHGSISPSWSHTVQTGLHWIRSKSGGKVIGRTSTATWADNLVAWDA